MSPLPAPAVPVSDAASPRARVPPTPVQSPEARSDEPRSDGPALGSSAGGARTSALKRSASERGSVADSLAVRAAASAHVPPSRPLDVVFDASNRRAYVLLKKLGAGTYAQVYAAHQYVSDRRPSWSAADLFARASPAGRSVDAPSGRRARSGTKILTARDLVQAAAFDDGPLSPALKRSCSASGSPATTAEALSAAALDTRAEWRCKSAHVAPWAAYATPNCVFKMMRINSLENGRVPDDDIIDEVQREFFTVRLMIEKHGRANVDPLISRPLDMIVEYDGPSRAAEPQSPSLTDDERAERAVRKPPIVRAGLVYKYDPRTLSLNQWLVNSFWASFSPALATEYAIVALEVGARLLDALGLMHLTALVHRDVKAANILVTPRSSRPVPDVKLTDMGFSMALRDDPLLEQFGLSAGYLEDAEREFFVDPDAEPRMAARYNTTYHVRDPATFSFAERRTASTAAPAAAESDAERLRRVRDKLFSVNEARRAFPAFDVYAAAVVVQRLFDPSDYPRAPAQFEIRQTSRMPPHTLVDILRDMTRKDYANRATAREYAFQLRQLAARLQGEREVERSVTPRDTRRVKR